MKAHRDHDETTAVTGTLKTPTQVHTHIQRVMPHSFFILQRLFLRVDNVLFRMYDVRIYHEFGTDEVIREIHGMEEDYESVKAVSLIL